jgi:hypothetical protein
MTAPLAVPVDVGAPPREPICRSAKDETHPCRFAGICHESRQRLAHYEGLRGRRCWAFQQMVAQARGKAHAHGDSILCFNCGADYTSEYWLESSAALWEKTRAYPDPMICRACHRPPAAA